MNPPDPDPDTPRPLPALRLNARGQRRVDYRAVLVLAVPLIANSGISAALNLTDTWFLGHLSTEAVAAMGAIFWLMLVFFLLMFGIGMAVQTLAAQAYGAGRRHEAAQAARTGFWCALVSAPFFLLIAGAGGWLLAPFHLAPEIERLALEFWWPRMVGGPASVALFAFTAFFNGIGRTRITLAVMAVVMVLNVVLNQWLIFGLGMGMAGAAWASTVSLAVGVVLAALMFLSASVNTEFASRRRWAPDVSHIANLFKLGMPMGLSPAADVTGFALFQLMLVSLGPVDGAATQIVMMLTSVAYMPAVGMAIAATTLVGQSIGAGDKDWAYRVGNAGTLMAIAYMGVLGLVLALGGPWWMQVFVTPGDPRAAEVVKLGSTLLLIAACYQVFDAIHLGANFSLRGAGDARVPALMLLVLSWFGFVPLAHMLAFAPGEGWVDFLPQLGMGSVGAWLAALIYMIVMSLALAWRWRSGAWRKISLL
jgi:MATE family multidrug resistance protein